MEGIREKYAISTANASILTAILASPNVSRGDTHGDTTVPNYRTDPEYSMKMIGKLVFLSATEAGELLGVDRRTIRRWCSDKERPADAPDLRPCRAPNGRVFFREDHIKALSNQFFGVETKSTNGNL